jgi:hypothetical protein
MPVGLSGSLKSLPGLLMVRQVLLLTVPARSAVGVRRGIV